MEIEVVSQDDSDNDSAMLDDRRSRLLEEGVECVEESLDVYEVEVLELTPPASQNQARFAAR